jgi:hypothetical protein
MPTNRTAPREFIRSADAAVRFPVAIAAGVVSVRAGRGESPAYVQRQLGHASIKLTVDTYGKWLPMSNRRPSIGSMTPNGLTLVAKR